MTRPRVVAAAVLAALLCAFTPAATSASAHQAPDGVLFYPSLGGLMAGLGGPHFCSASVLDSTHRDLVVTAAHCVYGTGATIEFAPGFRDGRAPYGVWSVKRIYVDPGWQMNGSAARDLAVLVIEPLGGRQIEDVVGGRPLGTPVPPASTTVTGYPLSAGRPSVCTGPLALSAGYPTISCPAGTMTDGVSGGAFVQRGRLVGVIGGPQQGGCTATVDYSSAFGPWTRRLLARAESNSYGDLVLPGFLANACT